mmetsp:Transcript_13173/g.48872  ORF Transcript_13173/g.48872 Transcript_13173/m.48872 type:complete len:386 (+) Transcript_13173:487-1644(+)
MANGIRRWMAKSTMSPARNVESSLSSGDRPGPPDHSIDAASFNLARAPTCRLIRVHANDERGARQGGVRVPREVYPAGLVLVILHMRVWKTFLATKFASCQIGPPSAGRSPRHYLSRLATSRTIVGLVRFVQVNSLLRPSHDARFFICLCPERLPLAPLDTAAHSVAPSTCVDGGRRQALLSERDQIGSEKNPKVPRRGSYASGEVCLVHIRVIVEFPQHRISVVEAEPQFLPVGLQAERSRINHRHVYPIEILQLEANLPFATGDVENSSAAPQPVSSIHLEQKSPEAASSTDVHDPLPALGLLMPRHPPSTRAPRSVRGSLRSEALERLRGMAEEALLLEVAHALPPPVLADRGHKLARRPLDKRSIQHIRREAKESQLHQLF